MRRGIAVSVGLLLALTTLCVLAPPASAWEIDQTATVASIIDGDTFDCSPTGRIRLADIDSPEYYEAGYQEATDYLSGLIAGQTVYLDIDDVYGTDQYGRWVAVVYVRSSPTELRNVNRAMLDAGHAVVWDFTNEFDPATWSSYVFHPIDAPPPTVTASASVREGVAPLTVAFSSAVSGGIPPYAYAWAFGDGGTSSAPNTSHMFRTGGTFFVTLTVTDAARRSGAQTISIVVGPPLSLAASADRTTGRPPLVVNFTADVSGGVSPYSYRWAFGDGNVSASQAPSHTYASAGDYAATLVVTDSANRTAGEYIWITVAVPAPAPSPPSSPPTAPAGIPTVTVGAVAAGLVGAAAVGYALFRRRRKGPS